jgi:hypothetical protein
MKTSPHPGDVTRVVARSDSADGGSAGTVLALWRFVTNGVTSKTHNNGHLFDLLPTLDDLLPVSVVAAAYHKDATTRLFSARSLRGCGHRHDFYGGGDFLVVGRAAGRVGETP